MIKTEPIPEDLQTELGNLRERVRQLEAEAKSRQDIEDQLNRFFTTLSDMFCVAGTDGTFKRLSPAWKNLLGFSLDELLGKPFLDFIHPDDHGRMLAAFETFRTTFDYAVLEARCRTKAGTYKWLQWRSIGVLDDQHIYAMAMDITARREAEIAAQKSANSLNAIFENTRQSFVLADTSGRILMFNKMASTITRMRCGKELQRGNLLREFFPQESRLTFDENFKKVLSGQFIQVAETISIGDAQPMYLCDYASPVYDDAPAIIGVLFEYLDITSHKHAEEVVRKSESNIKAILENTRQSFVMLSHEGKIISFNSVAAGIAESMTGKQLQEAAFYREFVPPEELLFYEANFASAMNGQTIRNETQITLPDGSAAWIEVVYNPVLDDAGKVSGVVIGTVNVTKRKQAELIIRQSEEKYRKLMEAANDAIFVTDEQTGIIIDANKKAEELIGRTGEELVGMFHGYLYPLEDTDQYKIFVKGNPPPTTNGLPQLYVQHSDGRKIPVEISTNKVEVGNRTILQSVFRDIRDRHQAELEKERLTEQLLRSQKMEAIGTLANGIAHDFNNIMGVVLMATNLLQQKTKDPTFQKHLKTVQEAVDRGAAIARQLLVFSRTAEMKIQPVAVSSVVKQVTRMLEHSLSKNISISAHTMSRGDVVLGDSNQLYQTFLNLGINAGDAMPNGGKLNFTVSTEPGGGFAEKLGRDVPEKLVVITVSDSGTGIPKDVLERIFDPFFTTKEVGKGTGLGLSIVHGIVKSHKGWIEVQSSIEQGTTFTIYLPAINQTVTETEQTSLQPLHGRGTILLVDDEMALRIGLAESLKDMGFSVIEARNGAEGLETYIERQSEIDLVITDLGMPRMNGDEMFRYIKDINEKVKVIMMTGYLMGERHNILLEQGVYDIIQKPFQMSPMLKIIRDAIQVA